MYTYFNPYKDYFWKWELDDSLGQDINNHVVEISNGQSIAYLGAIVKDLEDLSPFGLPSFGAFLLVLISASITIQDTAFDTFKNDILSADWASNKSITIHHAFRVLEYVRNLPDAYKTGENKLELLQIVFKDCKNKLGVKESQLLIEKVKGNKEYLNISSYQKEFDYNHIIDQDFKTIYRLVARFSSTEDIISAMGKVSISEDLVEEIEIETSLPLEVSNEKSFVEELESHEKTYEIGSLIKRIWSGLNIPMNTNLPSNQPLGGVSDITNKGDFGRLLISEFANDEDIFISRVVNNEALYIERETPPENNTKERVFLIDNSLRNWGVPKILSFATTLAIATHPKSDFSYQVYVVGKGYGIVSLHTTLDVINSQHLLSGELDCSEGLEAFLKENVMDGSKELFFLSQEESLKNSSLQNVIAKYHKDINYLITTNVNGDLNFYKHQNKSRKHFQHILLPYEELWKAKLPKQEAVKSFENKDLEQRKLLLTPLDKSNTIIIPLNSEVYVIQNNNLYALTSKGVDKGIQLVYEALTNTYDCFFTIIYNDKRERVLVSYSNQLQQIQRINLKTKEVITKKIFDKAFLKSKLLFNSKDKVILTNTSDFWLLDDVFKLHELKGVKTYKDSLLKYQTVISNFKMQLTSNRKHYNILRNITSITLKYNNINYCFLVISGFILNEQNFSKSFASSSSFNKEIDFTAKSTLYLKKVGENKLAVVKGLKEYLHIGLKEAREIVYSKLPLVLGSGYTLKEAEALKKKLEAVGAICFIKTNYFEAKDGSTIHAKNGHFIFKSSKAFIPEFYITAVLGVDIAMATTGEFAGNDYFLPVKNKLTTISLESFHTKYIHPFIKHIVDYEN